MFHSPALNTDSPARASMPNWAMHTRATLEEKLGKLSPFASSLLDASAGNSEFLARLITQQSEHFMLICEQNPAAAFETTMAQLPSHQSDKEALMQTLRIAKQQVALAVALADISGFWTVDDVVRNLSRFADEAVRIACRSLLIIAHENGTIALSNPNSPFDGSGLLVLAMGKHGAHELNYSSDIDLIVLFDPDCLSYQGRHSIQHFYTKLAQDMTELLQQRTREGYVFRTDLRLRPDPRSTPPAVNLASAITYYETVGQNWERAAMIKARPIAADSLTAERFSKAMEAYIWRRHLDFAAIADINSIKRQIDAKTGAAIQFLGHDVKIGRGGIREIEFFAQTQQLIWGGRDASLRPKRTIEALSSLSDAGHITPLVRDRLTESYWYLRRVEHHIQMLDDQQTHSVPESAEIAARLACFLGYNSAEAFESELLFHLHRVHEIYARSMESSPPLSLGGNLVFTGVEHDRGTLETLRKLGFSNAEWVSEQIQQWHRGHRRATRSKKARQILTELVPALLKAFSETVDVNDAFKRFDEFLAHVPVGVQIFSLLSANPEILDTLAALLGSAPALGDTLTRNPALLDLLLERENALPDKDSYAEHLERHLAHCGDYEESLRALRQFRQEQQFFIGLKALQGSVNAEIAMQHLSALADAIIVKTYALCLADYTSKTPAPEDFLFAVVGMGKLGTRELTFDSDLDLIFLFNSENSVFSQRFATRLMHAFTLHSKEGLLYELDLRLRPGGNTAPLATSIQRFESYFTQDGWDVEALALTRARVICSASEAFTARIHKALHAQLDASFDAARLATSIAHLRDRISKQNPCSDPWNLKYHAGGLIDVSLVTQYFRLVHPEAFADLLALPADAMLMQAAEHGILTVNEAETLSQAYWLQRQVQHVLRLCSIKQTIDANSSNSLQSLISRLMEFSDCEAIKAALIEAQAQTSAIFNRLFSAAN